MSRSDNVQGILGTIAPFWAKWGLGLVTWSPSFFCVVIQRTLWQLHNGRFSPNLVTKRSSVSRRGIQKNIFEIFHFRCHLTLKSETENWSNRHLTQSTLVNGCTAERYCFQGPVNFSLRHTVAELRGVKVAQFSDFGLFSP